jgi:polyphosphate kinase 2 (PPK2 family)
VFESIDSVYRVPFDDSFRVSTAATAPPEDTPSKKKLENRLDDEVERLDELQRILYAHDRHAVLLVFQAMDAAGKDGTIRAVMSGVNPAGCQVFSFKQPSKEELDHDFLWRCARRLPERGTGSNRDLQPQLLRGDARRAGPPRVPRRAGAPERVLHRHDLGRALRVDP